MYCNDVFMNRIFISPFLYVCFVLRLLRGLATFDLLFLLVAILAFGLPNLSSWYEENVFMRIMAWSFGFAHTFRVGSVYVTLAVTFERFWAIIFPLKHLRYDEIWVILSFRNFPRIHQFIHSYTLFQMEKVLINCSCILRNTLQHSKILWDGNKSKCSLQFMYHILIHIFLDIVDTNIHLFFQIDPETKQIRIESTSLRQNPIYVSLYVFWSKFILVSTTSFFSKHKRKFKDERKKIEF